MRKVIGPLLFMLLVLAKSLYASPAHAYAWMIRHGYAECGGCHVDPMGGETLTGMGRVMGESRLGQPWSSAPPSDLAKFLFGVTEPDDVRLGGSVRAMSIVDLDTSRTSAFPMQADLYGAGFAGRFTLALSLGVSRASSRYEHASKARLVGDIENEGVLFVSRNHWLGYHVNDDVMLRAGRMNLPFGLRMPEHVLWIRSETQTDRESDQQHGVSVVYTAGALRGELMASLGNFQIQPDGIRERGYSGHVEYLLEPKLALGVSSLVLFAQRERELDQGAVVRHAHGLTARYAPWKKWVVLAEADVLKATNLDLGFVGMAMMDFEPFQALHLAATGELLNRGGADLGASPGRGDTRIGGWLSANWFFGPHLDLRVDFVMRQSRAQMLQTQLHFYL